MKKSLLILIISLLVVSSAFGFNGVRKGFVLGGGLGLGMTSYTFSGGGSTSPRETEFSFMTDFKIGYAPTNQVEIVYNAKGSWFSVGNGSSVTFLHSIGSAAVNYYLKPEGPTFFVGGGLGLASLDPFEENLETWYGFGFFASGGYEFAKHFAVALDLMLGFPKESGDTFNGLTPRVVFVATAF